jgi:hypothetical protein
MEFLRDLLAEGRVLARDVQAAARGMHTAETLKRAKKDLKIKSIQEPGEKRKWWWSMTGTDLHWMNGGGGSRPDNSKEARKERQRKAKASESATAVANGSCLDDTVPADLGPARNGG